MSCMLWTYLLLPQSPSHESQPGGTCVTGDGPPSVPYWLRYFPANMVLYPNCCNAVAMVAFSLLATQSAPAQFPSIELFLAPWLWTYLPVKILERLGQQIGVETKALVNNVPWSITSSFSLVIGVSPPSAMSWSSVKIKMIECRDVFRLVRVPIGTGITLATEASDVEHNKKSTANLTRSSWVAILKANSPKGSKSWF